MAAKIFVIFCSVSVASCSTSFYAQNVTAPARSQRALLNVTAAPYKTAYPSRPVGLMKPPPTAKTRSTTPGNPLHAHTYAKPNFMFFRRHRITDEQRLMNKLFYRYSIYARPVLNLSHPVVVSMSLTITQIFELDEKNQVLITNAWANFEWRDQYLRWNPADFANLEIVRMTSYILWKPDIVLYNNAADFSPTQISTRAMVSYEGLIFWSVPNKFWSSCKIDVTYFPFDEQICHMKFGSWTYDGFKLDLLNSSLSADLTMYIKSGEWDLISAEQRRNVVKYTCCLEPYPDVTFYVHIRRKALYYHINVFVPCFLMSGLTLLVFMLPVESGEKCGLGVTIMLSFAVFMLTVIEKLPDTSESIPLVSIYLTAVMTLTAISLITTVAVLSLSHRSSSTARIPRAMRRLLNRAAFVCCIHSQSKDWTRQSYPVITKLTPAEFLHELSHELGVIKGHQVDDILHNPDRFRYSFATGVNRIIDRHFIDVDSELVNADWRRLAQYIDRSLFWILLAFAVSFTAWILIMYAPARQLSLIG